MSRALSLHPARCFAVGLTRSKPHTNWGLQGNAISPLPRPLAPSLNCAIAFAQRCNRGPGTQGRPLDSLFRFPPQLPVFLLHQHYARVCYTSHHWGEKTGWATVSRGCPGSAAYPRRKWQHLYGEARSRNTVSVPHRLPINWIHAACAPHVPSSDPQDEAIANGDWPTNPLHG